MSVLIYAGYPGGSVVKNLPANARDTGSIRGSGRFLGEGHGSPLQYSCLGSPLDRGAWWATVHRIVKIRTRLSDSAHMLTYVATNRKLQHFIICTLFLGTLFEPHSQFDGCSNLQIPRARTHPWWRSQFTVGRGPGGFHVQRGMSGSDSAKLLCSIFTRPEVLCSQDRGSLFYTDLNHMQILCISL